MNLDPDLIFVIGLIVGLLAIPPLIGAFSAGRPPRAAAIMVMISAGLITVAVIQKPTGYSANDVPKVFMDVVGRLAN